jgi:hypothetical protein
MNLSIQPVQGRHECPLSTVAHVAFSDVRQTTLDLQYGITLSYNLPTAFYAAKVNGESFSGPQRNKPVADRYQASLLDELHWLLSIPEATLHPGSYSPNSIYVLLWLFRGPRFCSIPRCELFPICSAWSPRNINYYGEWRRWCGRYMHTTKQQKLSISAYIPIIMSFRHIRRRHDRHQPRASNFVFKRRVF